MQTTEQRTIKNLQDLQELFGEISLDDLLGFESQLYEDRTFAIVHPVGKKIFDIIKNWDKFINFDSSTYYHARELKDAHRPFLNQEMMKT